MQSENDHDGAQAHVVRSDKEVLLTSDILSGACGRDMAGASVRCTSVNGRMRASGDLYSTSGTNTIKLFLL